MRDDTFHIKSGLMLLAGIILIIVSQDGSVNRLDGVLLLLVFFAFMFHASKTQRVIFGDDEAEKQKLKFKDVQKDIAFFILGSLSVVIGSRILVDSGIEIAELIGVPEVIIA